MDQVNNMKKIFIFIAIVLLVSMVLSIRHQIQNCSGSIDTIDVDYIYLNDTVYADTLSEIEKWYRSEEGMRELMRGCGEEPMQ